jgi:hypothetical protein
VISKTAKGAIIIGHAVVGWAYCAALIGVGTQFMSMDDTLIMHAIGAPVGFALVALCYFKRFAFTSPLQTAGLFLGAVITLDVVVVALLIARSFAMFESIVGTWLPLALIFGATYATGLFVTRGKNLHPRSASGG